jgi:Peptidase family M28/PA domain
MLTFFPSAKSRLLISFLAVATVAGSAAAQSPSQPWFGLPAPGPVTETPVDFTHLDLPRIPAPDASKAPELQGAKLVQYVKDIAAFSYASRDAGDQLWGRLAGSKYTDEAVEYVAKQLRDAGLSVTEVPVPFVRANDPIHWSVRVLGAPEFGPGSDPIELKSAVAMPVGGPAAGGRGEATNPDVSGPHTVTAPVVFVGEGNSTNLAMVDVKGKIAVMVKEPVPTAFYSGAEEGSMQTLVQAGAVGVIEIYDMPGNMQVFLGGCGPQALCFTVGGEDGAFLRAAIEHAAAAKALDKLQVELSVTRSGPQNLTAHALVAKLAGRDPSENIVLSTHSDSWFTGANDNASGMAGLIGLAKQYAKGPKPQHDFYFFLSPGHHSPTNGTASLVKYDPSLPKNNIVLLNLEHIGQAGTYRIYSKSTTDKYGNRAAAYVPTNWDSQGREVTMGPDSAAIKKAWIDAAIREQYTGPAIISNAPVAEIAPFVAAGGAGIQDVETSPWFHTTGDSVDTISPEAMQRVTLFYKDFIDTVDKLSREEVQK